MGSRSLWEPLDRSPRDGRLLTTWEGDAFRSWTWDDWRRRADAIAAGLCSRGVRPGEPVACVITNGFEACATVLGVWLAGGQLVSLPLIARGMKPDAYARQLRRLVTACGATTLLADAAVAPLLESLDLPLAPGAFQDLRGRGAVEPDPPPADAPAFVQYSSGSTSDPRGCVLTPAAVAAQLSALERHLAFEPGHDAVYSWLPLSHDMGLFGTALLAYWTGTPLVLGTPERFLRDPRTWFEDCATFGVTTSVAPCFALDLATRAASHRAPPPFALERLVIGGDHIDARTLRGATELFGPDRLPWHALVPAYGLAEAVLAVTLTELRRGPRMVDVDAAALEEGAVEPVADGREPASGRTATLVSSGTPIPDVELVAPTDEVAEIVVSSPWLARGYLGEPGLTRERFTGDGLRTGDLGFVRDGALYVTGRSDDLFQLGGRNLYAADIEGAIAQVEDVRPGRCAVVPLRDGAVPLLVALVEASRPHRPAEALARDVKAAALDNVGVRIAECVLVPRGTLPKTPSGKLQRFRCRALADELLQGDHRG
ncbi:MAG TPA: AMP-binding protein [Thermoleophilaceae bacterium]|nr:AMP-binding protein [Thermoleophilaceae bacterium]